MKYIVIIIIALIGLFGAFFYFKKVKRLKLPNVYLFTGAVKSGKSALSVYYILKQYRKNVRSWTIRKYLIDWWLCKFKKGYKTPLKPQLYSNIPLACVKYTPLTLDIVLRKVRIPNKSCCLIDEASLFADSMTFKNFEINENLSLFVKLYAHYSHGGTLVFNTQSLHDLHFAIKRSVSQIYFITSKTRLPFITLFYVSEMLYNADSDSISSIDLKEEESQKCVIVKNKYFKYYDRYCYSILTDNLDIYNNPILSINKKGNLKTKDILRIKNAIKKDK